MKQIIAFFIVSGGIGFFNLYLAQETDFLYFGKYNKEERIAWVSIFTVANYLLITDYINITNESHSLLIAIATFIMGVFISVVGSFLLPKSINWVIDYVRHCLGKPYRSFLPPINSFFEDIENYHLFSFDFDGKFISSGKIKQGTEERQETLSLLITPSVPDEDINYSEFLKFMSVRAVKGKVTMSEFTDYTNKVHFIKIKDTNTN